jgi:hypothetical protein
MLASTGRQGDRMTKYCKSVVRAAILAAWALAAGASIFENPLAFKVHAGLLAGAAFFSTIGLITFAGSKISPTFCQVFEGPVNQEQDTFSNYCGYHDGFGIAVAAAVMTGASALIQVFYMPWAPPSLSAGAPQFTAVAADASYGKIGGPADAVAVTSFNAAA